MRSRLLMAGLLLSMAGLPGCTFVKMAPGADAVRVAASKPDLSSSCQKRGEIAVSVKDRLGPYQRDEIRVRDELETLARNEAPGLGADTVQPVTEPKDGEQRWLAWRCAGAVPAAAKPADSAQTYPIKDNP